MYLSAYKGTVTISCTKKEIGKKCNKGKTLMFTYMKNEGKSYDLMVIFSHRKCIYDGEFKTWWSCHVFLK